MQVKLDEMQKQLQVSGSPEQDLYAQYEGRVSEDAVLMDSLFARHSDSPLVLICLYAICFRVWTMLR